MGGIDLTSLEYLGLTAHVEPCENVAKVGYEAFKNAPKQTAKESVCSAYGPKYIGYPTTSRKNGITEIFSDCNMNEEFYAVGYDTALTIKKFIMKQSHFSGKCEII